MTVCVLYYFIAVPCVGLRSVTVAFSGSSDLLFHSLSFTLLSEITLCWGLNIQLVYTVFVVFKVTNSTINYAKIFYQYLCFTCCFAHKTH